MDQTASAAANPTTNAVDTSRLSSTSSVSSKRAAPNFIEKNKALASRPAKGRAADAEAAGGGDSGVVVKCLNEIDANRRPTAVTSTTKTASSKTTSSVRVAENLPSARSSTSSLASSASRRLHEVKTTTTASVLLKPDAGATPVELEISIISNHSSIVSDRRLAKAVSPGPLIESATAKEAPPDPEANKQQIRNFLHELNRMHEGGSSVPAPSVNSHSSPIRDLSHNLSLQQGEERPLEMNNASVDENEQEEEDDDDDLYISQSDQDKRKIRSLMAERYSRPAATNMRRTIIPNFIEESAPEFERPPRDYVDYRSERPLSMPIVKPRFHVEPCLHDHFEPVQQTETGASLAAIVAANSAVAQRQNELDMKMSDVLNKLDSLRKSDDQLSSKLAEKKRLERMRADEEWLAGEADEPRPSSRLDDESSTRLKYYEQLQEKQFALMSQLISVIGKENKSAARNVEDTRANLKSIKRQFRISEPAVNEPIDPMEFDQHPSRTLYQRGAARKSSSRSKKSVSPFKAAPSRSRSRNRSNSAQQRKPRRGNKSSTSSRSQSRSRTASPLKRSLSPLGNGRSLSRSRSNSRGPKKGGKKGQFLQDLLDRNKSPNGSLLGPRRTSSSSLTGKKRLDQSYFDDKPTLFDKYLNQVKSQTSQSANLMRSSASSLAGAAEDPANKAPSMFSDIKEVLKAVEYSKNQIETSLKDLARERDNKMYYLLSTFSDDQNERARMKKLVDGCVSAISNDVQKIVSQKLIDESKHAKLEAERDVGPLSGRNQPHANRAFQKRLSSSQAGKVVGFGSSTARSSSALEKPKSTVSNTNKYIGKVYGRTLLDEIKFEETQARNALRLQQQQQQREALKARQAAAANAKNQATKPGAKKQPSAKAQAPAIDPARPAFLTSQLIPYPENKVRAFQTSIPEAMAPAPSQPSNVAVVTMKPKSKSPLRRSKELIRQDLPPVNITPGPTPNPAAANVTIDNQTRTITDESEFDVNQSGTGIQLPGFKRPSDASLFANKSSLRTGGGGGDESGNLSNETARMVRVRDSLENGVLDWIEQELMARFINNMAKEQDEQRTEESRFEPKYEADFEEDDETPSGLAKSLEMLDLVNKKGFQIFVDVGQPVDPNLIEALAREVLEEKVASMISNGLDSARATDAPVPRPPESAPSQPQPSPRRPTVDYYLSTSYEQAHSGADVPTPIPTPHESPVPTPRATTPRITPQVSVERNEAPPLPPQQQQQQQQPQYVYLIPHAAQDDDDDNSMYEEITEEQNDVELELDIDPRTINVPKTPEETPIPTPSPEVTPEASLVEPAPVAKPQPPQRNLVTTSVQCDPPEPVSRAKTPPPPPPPQVQPVQPASPKPKSKLRKIKVESISIEPSETEMTSSSAASDDDLSTTLDDTSKSSEAESDSYMSEGAWIISKSEGQIVFEEEQAFTNVDLAVALKGRPILSRNLTADTASEGEIRCDKLGKEIPAKPGKSRISVEAECGELSVGETKKIQRQIAAYDRSEGEVESGVGRAGASARPSPKKASSSSSIGGKPTSPVPMARRSPTPTRSLERPSSRSPPPKSPSPTKQMPQEKTVVDLAVSPKRQSKNNIRVQPISSDSNLRGSADFEKKIISSTPDTSMLAGPSDERLIAGSHPELNELELLDGGDYEDYEDLREYERKLRQVQASSDAYTERDEDTTLNDSTDIEP